MIRQSLLTLITATLFIAPITESVNANAHNISVEEMSNYLIEQGWDKNYFSFIDDKNKITELYHKFKNGNVKCETQTSYLTMHDNETEPLSGVIKSSDMQLNVTKAILHYPDSNNHIERVYISISYEWLDIPMWRKNDAVIVNWDSSVLTYSADSFTCHNKAIIFAGEVITNLTAPSELVQGSLGYVVELPRGQGVVPTELYGLALFELIPQTNPMYSIKEATTSDYMTTSINAQYRHNGNPFAASVGLSVSGVSISFNLDSLTYTTATSVNLYYKH